MIADLLCPYCGAALRVAREVEGDADRLRYGLLGCRCFEFPVVDGILLLSLARAYGGAEEELLPYVPLQVAAIHYLQRDDVPGLRAWMGRHLPLAAELIDGHPGSYVDFTTRFAAQLGHAAELYLSAHRRFEHLGRTDPMSDRQMESSASARRSLQRLRSRLKTPVGTADEQPPSYYLLRFLSPRLTALALQLESLPMAGRVLSLCCGHGVFENLLRAQRREPSLVCVDAQFLNLLVTRYFIAPDAAFICHDVQFPLPFRSGYFDGVFSSTCLPEIPTQRSFVRESLRVTSDHGWSLFDSIWSLEMPLVYRVNPIRHYRFCQNFFQTLDDYLPFFDECAEGRRLAVDVSDVPTSYLAGGRWEFDRATAESALRAREDSMISVLAVSEGHFLGFERPTREWLRADSLAVSPAFEVSDLPGGASRLRLRDSFRAISSESFSAKGFAGLPDEVTLEPSRFAEQDYLIRLFCEGVLAPLPAKFDRSVKRLTRDQRPDGGTSS